MVGPYSKRHALTRTPLGFTVAFTVAEVCVTDEAAPVTTIGAVVVNIWSAPVLSPPAFLAKIRTG